MRKNKLYTAMTLLIALLSIIPLFFPKFGTTATFGVYIYKTLLVAFWILYFLILILLRQIKIPISKYYMKYSFIGVLVIVCLGTSILKIRSINYDSNYTTMLKTEELNKMNTLDSLIELSQEKQEDSKLYYNIGREFKFKENYKKAIYYFEKAIQQDSNISLYYMQLGKSYLSTENRTIKDVEKALENYQKAYMLDTSNKFIDMHIKATEDILKEEIGN